MPELEKIRIGLGALAANQCIPWVAQDAGLFHEEGLEAIITFEPPAKRTLQVVFENIVDVCTFGGYPVVRAAGEGKEVEIILNLNDFNHLSIIAQNDIKKPEDLRGHRIGGFSLKGNADFTLDILFSNWGLTGKEGDPERVPYWDGFQAAYEGLIAGEVEAAILPLPFSSRAIRDGYNLIWDGQLMPYQGGVGFALKSFSVEKKELANRFLSAYKKGIRTFKSDPDLSKSVLHKNIPSIGDDETLEATYDFWSKNIPYPPVPSLEGIQVILDGIANFFPETKLVRPIDCVARSLWPELGGK